MRFLIVGDLHLTERQPESRNDNFVEVTLYKFEFLLRMARNENCRAILSPGDFTDSPITSWRFFTKVMDLINNYDIPIFTVYGQHDLRYRNRGNTFLDALGITVNILQYEYFNDEIKIFGSSYEENIPKPDENKFSILLVHKMIIEDKLWSKQEDYEMSSHFLRKHKFDLIVSGDNHQSFFAKNGKRFLFNCGSMTRLKSNQEDHQPICIVFDTEDRSYKTINIPIKKGVFKTEKFEKELDVNLSAFISGLKDQEETGLDFVPELMAYCKINDVKKGIMDEINEAISNG